MEESKPLKVSLIRQLKKISNFFRKRKQENRKIIYYEPTYISLYGLSSAEDFYQRVFVGVNGWANNGVIRLLGLGASKAFEFIGVSTEGKNAKTVTCETVVFIVNSNYRISFKEIL